MGSVLRFPRPADRRPESQRSPRDTEVRFRYPADDVIDEISCDAEPREKQVVAKAPHATRSA